mgnify:CR=1 FL=1
MCVFDRVAHGFDCLRRRAKRIFIRGQLDDLGRLAAQFARGFFDWFARLINREIAQAADWPGPRLIPPAQLKRKCSREKTRDDKRSPPTSRHAQFSFDCRCSNRWSYSQWLENSWLERQPRFRCSLHHSVDRIGTGPQEHYSGWFLGMQRNRLDPAADLLRVLPPRFGRVLSALFPLPVYLRNLYFRYTHHHPKHPGNEPRPPD